MEGKLLLLILLGIFSQASSQSINCVFADEPRGSSRLYSCNANIQNPNGADNLPITSVDGHLDYQEDEEVRMLNIVAGTSSIMPRVFCDQFSNMVVIEFLANVQMRTINAESFAGCTKIREIFIRSNPIEVLPLSVLINNNLLKIFHLSDTQLTSLPFSLFATSQTLQDVVIADNQQLSDIPSEILSTNQQVKTVDFSNNQLTAWPVEWFSSLTNLNQLIIDDNDLVQIPQGAIASSSLTSLSINSCGIERLDLSSLGSLNSLTDLHIADNQLAVIDEDIFSQALSLTRLNATRNVCVDANFDNFNRNVDLVALQGCFVPSDSGTLLNVCEFYSLKLRRF